MYEFLLICCGISIGLIIAWTIYNVRNAIIEKKAKKIIARAIEIGRIVKEFKPTFDKVSVVLAKRENNTMLLAPNEKLAKCKTMQDLIENGFGEYYVIAFKDIEEKQLTKMIIMEKR